MGMRGRRAMGDVMGEKPRFYLHGGDSLTWLQEMDDACVDLIITDPPYESLEKHRRVGTTTRLARSKASSNVWFSTIANAALPGLFEQLFRVLKDNSHCYMFCDAETAFMAKPAGEQAGFKFWKPLVWDKMKIGMGYHYRARYEFILFFEKGKRRLNNLGVPDVIQAARVFNGYPTEKPVLVSEVLVKQSTDEGQLVLDPFAGSGSVGVAALRHNRCFVGADVNDDAIALASARLRAAEGCEDNGVMRYRAYQPITCWMDMES